jgi:hypothetical protein
MDPKVERIEEMGRRRGRRLEDLVGRDDRQTDRQRACTCDQDFAKRDLRRRVARTRHIAEDSIERSVGVCVGCVVVGWQD